MKGPNFVNRLRSRSDDQSLLYGIHAIDAWVRRRPERIRLVRHTAEIGRRGAEVVQAAVAAGVSTKRCEHRELADLVGTVRHQGLVAAVGPFPYADLMAVVSGEPRLVIAADQLQDPQNLGAVIRTARAFGAGAVVLPQDASVPVTATVEVAAAGAAAFLPVCRVTNLTRALGALKASGMWAVGLATHGGQSLFGFAAPARVCLVLGGETGLRRLVAAQCDFHVSIPMVAEIESLNASVAAAVAVYELRRQWSVP